MPINDNDHEQLHDWVLRAALAGSAFSVLSLLIAGSPGTLFFPLLAALQIVIVVGVIVPPRSIVDGAGLLMLGLIGAAMSELRVHPVLPISAALFGLGLARGIRPIRHRMLTLGLGTVGALGGLVIQRGLTGSGVLSPFLGQGLSALVSGAFFGAAVGLGAIGRLLGSRPTLMMKTPELEVLATQIHSASPDVAALLRRASDAHLKMVDAPTPAQKAATDLLARMVVFAREWLDIEQQAKDTRPESLTERMALLEARLEKSSDQVTVAELERAIDAVRSQADALSEILAGRDRTVARLEHQVATLERLRFAALRHRSADASRLAAELAPVLEELADAGGDYDLASDALKEGEQLTT